MAYTEYLSTTNFKLARLGVETKGFAADTDLQEWIIRASIEMDRYAQWSFQPATYSEQLWSGTGYGVVIENTGDVLIYPRRGHPIQTINSLTWREQASSDVPVDVATACLLVPNQYGDNHYVRCELSMDAVRGPRNPIRWTINYDAGYPLDPVTPSPDDYPTWLQDACLYWTAALLLKRGAQALVIQGSGQAVDTSTLGKWMDHAKELLGYHKRVV